MLSVNSSKLKRKRVHWSVQSVHKLIVLCVRSGLTPKTAKRYANFQKTVILLILLHVLISDVLPVFHLV